MFLRDDGVEVVAEDGKNHVPHTGTDGGVEDEVAVVHLRQSGGNRDEMSDARDKSSGDCSELAVVVEVSLTLLNLLLVEQTEVPEPAVGESVDDRSSEVVTGEVVDCCADIGSEGGKEHDEEGIEASARGMVGCRCHDELRGHGDDGALKEHEDEHREVVQVVEQR